MKPLAVFALFPAVAGAVMLFDVSLAHAQAQVSAGLREQAAYDCIRPTPPSPHQFASRGEYWQAREDYYQAASAYVSECIDRWIEDTRKLYIEMFDAETRSYMLERQRVMDEMTISSTVDY